MTDEDIDNIVFDIEIEDDVSEVFYNLANAQYLLN